MMFCVAGWLLFALAVISAIGNVYLAGSGKRKTPAECVVDAVVDALLAVWIYEALR